MSMMSKFKKFYIDCPFCGGDVEFRVNFAVGGEPVIHCLKCGAWVYFDDVHNVLRDTEDPDEAAEKAIAKQRELWNKRTWAPDRKNKRRLFPPVPGLRILDINNDDQLMKLMADKTLFGEKIPDDILDYQLNTIDQDDEEINIVYKKRCAGRKG